MTFTFFTNGTVKRTGIGRRDRQPEAAGSRTRPAATGALAAGSYSFRATYNGDTNYNASPPSCEPFTVGKADTDHRHRRSTTPTTARSAVNLGPVGFHRPRLRHRVGPAARDTDGDGDVHVLHQRRPAPATGIGAGTVNLVQWGRAPVDPDRCRSPRAATRSGPPTTVTPTTTCPPRAVNRSPSARPTPPPSPTFHNANHDVIPNGGSVPAGHDHARLRHRRRHRCGHPDGQRDLHVLRQRHLHRDRHRRRHREPGQWGRAPLERRPVRFDRGAATRSGPPTTVTPTTTCRTSGCEPFSVSKADSTTVTALHNANHDVIPNGSSVPAGHDHARLRHRLRHRCGHPHRQRDLHVLRQRRPAAVTASAPAP